MPPLFLRQPGRVNVDVLPEVAHEDVALCADHAIIGGAITSTLLTLVVVPVIYTYLDALDQRLRPKPHGGGALGRQPADKA